MSDTVKRWNINKVRGREYNVSDLERIIEELYEANIQNSTTIHEQAELIRGMRETLGNISKIEQSECYEKPAMRSVQQTMMELQSALRKCGDVARAALAEPVKPDQPEATDTPDREEKLREILDVLTSDVSSGDYVGEVPILIDQTITRILALFPTQDELRVIINALDEFERTEPGHIDEINKARVVLTRLGYGDQHTPDERRERR